MADRSAGNNFFIIDGQDNHSPPDTWQGGWPRNAVEFEALVEAFQHKLVRYAFRRLGSLQDAEDTVQDVLLKVYTGQRKLRKINRVIPYIYRMLANACTDFLRKHSGRQVSLDELKPIKLIVKGGDSTEEAALRELKRIETLLAALPSEQAEVIRLRILDELSFVQIAETIDVSLPTVKSRFRYGLEKLRSRVQREREV